MSIRLEAFLSILVAGALAAGLVSAPAFAGKKISPPAGCVIFPPAYVDTGNPFQVKIVKDPSYPGGWVAPLVEAAATFKVRGPGTVTVSYTGSVSRYGVTYVYATLNAPSCDGTPCFINTSVDAVITATVYEPLSDGSLRETVCAPAQVSVNPAS